MAFVDITNRRFGGVVALRAIPTPGRKTRWACKCDCGIEFETCGGKLRYGEVISCQQCARKRVSQSRIKHGGSMTSEYRIWTHIKSRCLNKKVPEYKHYGGRGISICDRWRESFENFIADMGSRPSALHSIDRIDNNGNYEPSNCRWSTQKEQTNNTRANRKVLIDSETKNMTQWADSIGIKKEIIFKRLKRGISGKRLLEAPFAPKTFVFNGVEATIPEWSAATGIQSTTLYWRINKQQWPLEKALTLGAKHGNS